MPTGIYKHKISTILELVTKRYVVTNSGCWEWTGTIAKNGYGILGVGGRGGKKVYAHRASYEIFSGKIPFGLEIDHLCRNRECVNPEHLEAVTRRINILRGSGPKILGLINGNKTHCLRGHEFNEKNTRNRKSGGRTCVICEKQKRTQRDKGLTPQHAGEEI